MILDGLLERQRRVIEAIVSAPLGWTSRAAISRHAHTRSGPVLDGLEAMEWVARWHRDRHGKPLKCEYWTLTPLGAARAGVRMDEEREGTPRWYTGPVAMPIRSHEITLRYPERIADPRPPAEYVADLDTGETTTDRDRAQTIHGVPIRTAPRKRRPGARGSARTPGNVNPHKVGSPARKTASRRDS